MTPFHRSKVLFDSLLIPVMFHLNSELYSLQCYPDVLSNLSLKHGPSTVCFSFPKEFSFLYLGTDRFVTSDRHSYHI